MVGTRWVTVADGGTVVTKRADYHDLTLRLTRPNFLLSCSWVARRELRARHPL